MNKSFNLMMNRFIQINLVPLLDPYQEQSSEISPASIPTHYDVMYNEIKIFVWNVMREELREELG